MNLEEIKNEIVNLEQADTNWQNIQRLAWLYAVHDHFSGIGKDVKRIMPEYAGEFGEVVSGVNIDKFMDIISEHMSVIKILHPKEYRAVLDRIAGIPR